MTPLPQEAGKCVRVLRIGALKIRSESWMQVVFCGGSQLRVSFFSLS